MNKWSALTCAPAAEPCCSAVFSLCCLASLVFVALSCKPTKPVLIKLSYPPEAIASSVLPVTDKPVFLALNPPYRYPSNMYWAATSAPPHIYYTIFSSPHKSILLLTVSLPSAQFSSFTCSECVSVMLLVQAQGEVSDISSSSVLTRGRVL